jgi:hypothetical protein
MPLNTEVLREEIQKVYSQVMDDPKKGYHFHTGPDYAAERLGYVREELAELPGTVTTPRRVLLRLMPSCSALKPRRPFPPSRWASSRARYASERPRKRSGHSASRRPSRCSAASAGPGPLETPGRVPAGPERGERPTDRGAPGGAAASSAGGAR